MKVVHLGIGVIPVPPPGDIAAGGEEYVYVLTRYLSRLECEVHVIDIKGGAQQREKRQQSSAKFHELWRLPLPYRYRHRFLRRYLNYLLTASQTLLFAVIAAFSLNRLLAKEKIDIVHVHNENVALAAIIVNKLRRNNTITVYTPFSAYGLTKFSWRKRLIYFAEIPTLRWIDHIVASTPSVKQWMISEFNLDPAKITQIRAGGTDLDEVEGFLFHKEGVCHQSNMVLCAGGIMERKNQLTAVKAMAKVVSVHPEVKIVFTGPFSQVNYFNSIQSFVTENGLSSYVELRGEVTKQELYSLYSDAILFLFPTTAEVDPAVLREALAFGLPIIASNIEPIADMVGKGEGSAILLDPYDVDGIAEAVIRLLEDNSLRQSMSEKAKELGQALSYENIAAQILAMYNKLVQGKKGGRD
ncbi:glycosyltransferase family 4 protein [Chloroflexota bacterium]